MNKKPLNSETEVGQLHAIADKLKPSFKKMGINTIADLLWYFPYRYDDLSQVKQIENLEEDQLTTIKVKIKNIKTYRSFKQKMMITEVLASDETDDIHAIWFRQKFVSQVLKNND
ncbi:hypothetical protein K8R42_04675 [bacterium]|nr:hypothetical protein [bacterium]